jgi:hypothetical protein
MRATAVVAMHPRRTVAPPRASGGVAWSVSRRSGVPGTVGVARSRAVAASRRRRVAFVAAVPAPAPAPGATRSSIVRTHAARRVVARARDDAGGDAESPEAVPGDAGDVDVDVDDDAGDASAPDASGEADEDEEDEYEEVEVEVEVDYTPLDHARDALDSLGTWSDVSAWPRAKDDVADVSSTPSALASTAFAVEATRAFSAAPGGALPMAPVSGLAVAFAFAVGAVFGRKSAESKSAAAADVLADLAGRAGGAGAGGAAAGFQPMTEEQRVADEARKAKKAEEARLAELARRKKRDEDEAKFVASEKARLEKEAAAARKAAEEEEKRRAKARAELAERAEIERVYLEEKRAKEEAERARREAEALAEQERKREQERLEMEARLAKQNAERERRGETTRRFEVSAFVSFAYRAARGDVEVEVRARAGISSPATESGVYASVAQARVAATAMCTSVARTAVASWASDQRLKLMTGDAGPNSPLRAADASEHAGGFDECEFEHWTRVGGARLDAELRALTQRAGAGVEFKMRAPGGGDANQSASSEAELVVERAALPLTDRDNVANRLYAAMLAAGDGAFGVASDDLEWVARFELGQLHGLDGGLCFPAVTQADLSDPDKRLKGGLLALMVTLSHWLARARLELLGSAGADPEASDADPGARKTYANCAALANRMLTTEANAEGASWKAMYLDGFSGDVLSQAASTARAVLSKRDPIRAMLEAAEEEQRRKLAGVPTTDEEAYPDREASRKARHKAERDAVPLAEKLWAMRNAAAQMAVSGSKGQARSMLEEAYQLRVEALAKQKAREEEENSTAFGATKTTVEKEKEKPGTVVVAPETLPELTALEDLFASEKAWSRELAGVRAQVLKAVRTAADRAASAGDNRRAAALLEGAAREYGGERKLGPEHPAARAAFAAAEKAWAAAGIDFDDEDAKDSALAEAAGTPVPRGQGGGIVLRLTKKYLEELEARRK